MKSLLAYETGKDVQNVLNKLQDMEARLREMEAQLEELEERSETAVDAPPTEIQVCTAALAAAEAEGAVRSYTVFWRDLWRNEMHTIESKMTIYEDGSFRTHCDMKDESRHRKYGNQVFFRIKYPDGGAWICDIGGSGWTGNFSPRERKQYASPDPFPWISSCIRDNFDRIVRRELWLYRSWRAWKRG